MDLGIAGKQVLVTGASQGIGREIALAFAREGCKVIIIARREKELQDALATFPGSGHGCIAADLLAKGTASAVAKDALERFGTIDIVVHNLGGTLEVKDVLSPADDWERVWRLNVGVAIDMNHVLVPPMQEQEWGRIIHISSISGESLRGAAPYGCAKAYVNAYTKVLGRALAKDGIIVSAILPGAIYAPGGHWDENAPHNHDKEAFFRKRNDFLRHHHAVGRFGTADEIAPFAVFLASKHVTFAQGAIVPVDGGTM
jgi:3-oxoacyl-[acyl-carrier protein] reductase